MEIQNNIKTLSKNRQDEILSYIFDKETVTREKISNELKLNSYAVYTITGNLIKKKIVSELDEGYSTGGRKNRFLSLNKEIGYTIGISVGESSIKAGICSVKGEIFKSECETIKTRNTRTVISTIYELIKSIIKNASKSKIYACGIGLPGIINFERTKGVFSNHFSDWKNVEIKEILEKQIKIPVYIEHECNITAFGYFYELKKEGYKNLIYIYIGNGVGMGVISDGKVFKGGKGVSNEIGHMIIDKGGKPCICGNRGCLGAMINISSLILDVKNLLDTGVISDLDKNNLDFNRVVEGFKAKDKIVLNVIEELSRNLTIAMINLVNLFSPEIIVIGGPISRLGSEFERMINHEIFSHIWNGNREIIPQIRVSENQDNDIKGAGLFAFKKIIEEGKII